MARIKIDIPPAPVFILQIPVRITDINYGNHLGNDALVSILHEARMRWLRSGNYTELDVEGASLIMGDLSVEYIAEAYYADVLHISVNAGEVGRVNFDVFYSISNRHGKLIAKAKTGMVCFNYQSKKVVSVPEKFKLFLSGNSVGTSESHA